MKDRLGCLSLSGALIAGCLLLGVLGWTLVAGPGLFSAGGLNATAKAQVLGGVSTHAQLERRCEACHTAPWSSTTMADRCMACHTDIAEQLKTQTGLHAQLPGSPQSPTCRGCHTDHRGPKGLLTFFDHSKLRFKLVGAHRTVACDLCHPGAKSLADFQNAPQTCNGCHAKNDPHHGSFGQECGQCHSMFSWKGANFDHRIFPVNHGSKAEKATCKTCHPNGVRTYTCFGCHAHTPTNVVGEHEGKSLAQITDCIKCHAGGKKGDN